MNGWWRPEKSASVTWLGLFLPGLMCYLHFLLEYLNGYPEVDGSTIARLVPDKFDEIIPLGAKVEVVAGGFNFTEGPVWVHDKEADRQYLLFSDVSNNRIWKWEEGGGMFTLGKSLFLDRSGCRGDHCSALEYPGSSGLTLDPGSGDVVICEHGDRRVTRMEKNGTRTPLATHFNGNRLASPNDLAFSKHGDLYFTDRPLRLPEQHEHPSSMTHGVGGVYRVRRENVEAARAGESQAAAEPELLDEELAWPSGLAFSPDFSKLYLSVCPPQELSPREDCSWHVYDVGEDGGLADRRLLLSTTSMKEASGIRYTKGVKVDERGNIFAAGPGGVAVISAAGEHLGTVFTGGVFVTNLVLAGDGYLYVTASESIMRVKVLTKAAPAPVVDA